MFIQIGFGSIERKIGNGALAHRSGVKCNRDECGDDYSKPPGGDAADGGD